VTSPELESEIAECRARELFRRAFDRVDAQVRVRIGAKNINFQVEESAMGREGQRNHLWTPDDEGRLEEAVAVCEPLIDHYQNQGYTMRDWWDAVAGRMAPDVLVTGGACQRRWDIIGERKRAEAEAERAARASAEEGIAEDLAQFNDAWQQLEDRVDAWERDYHDTMLDRTERIERMLKTICNELGVEVEACDRPSI